MFGLWLPHSLIWNPNPIFDYELRHLRWPRSEGDMIRYSRTVIFLVCLVFVVRWAVGRQYYFRYSTSDKELMLMLGFLTAAIMLVSNFFYALLTVGTISREIASGQWDQLRLTGQGAEGILLAKYAILQIRAWPLMMVDIALRVAGLVIFVLVTLYGASGSPPYMFLFVLTPFGWSALLSLIALGTAYSLEPLWRMRAVISVALAVATRIHSLPYALLGVLGSIVLNYVVLLVMLVAFIFVVSRGFVENEDTSYLLFLCGVPFLSAASFYAYYVFYRTIRDRAVEYAFRVGLGGKNLRSYIGEVCWG